MTEETGVVRILVHNELDQFGVYLICTATGDANASIQSVRACRVTNLDDAQPRDLACWNDFGAEDLIEIVLGETFGSLLASELLSMIKKRCAELGRPLPSRPTYQ